MYIPKTKEGERKMKRLEKIIKYARRSSKLETAKRIASRFIKPAVVVLGDDGYYWIVTIGEAQALERAGYEIAW